MSTFPPNPASRRPEGTWGQDDEDFRIMPPASGVSAPPVSAPMPSPPVAPAPVAPAPPPRPVPAVAPMPRVPAKPATQDRQKLYIAAGAAAIILAAILFFVIFSILGSKTAEVPAAVPTVEAKGWGACASLTTAVDD